MKIVLAFDSFKGSLSAAEACRLVRETILRTHPTWAVIEKPMGDGGEGTAEAMIGARGGEWIPARVMGPLPERQVDAGFAWFPTEQRALVEMASASGLPLLRREERNPLLATTYGTGQLIRQAMSKGGRLIWLAVGGSATVDGGVGAAMALGWRFLDAQGKDLGLGGGALERLHAIEAPPDIGTWPPMEVLCDVDNPLCGSRGAARVFGPQKGATPEMVERLEAGLHRLGEKVAERLGKDILTVPGAGAAGGLAAGAIAFLNAKLVSGIATVMDASGLETALNGADWVITGEGSFDEQSLRGKVVSGVVRMARDMGARVAVIAGRIGLAEAEYRTFGVARALALRAPGMSTDEAIAHSRELLAARTNEWIDGASGMEDPIGAERAVHGRRWGELHDGYFSDPAIARPLVETVRSVLTRSPADVVVDLGGGTGFLLSQLSSHGIGFGTTLVNLDCSEPQLALADNEGLSPVRASIGTFRRHDVVSEGQRCFFIMRSVLHYLGADGLSPWLRHLRDQAKEGELFVHQSASFDKDEESACLNALYRHMRTRKWYPTTNDLRQRLAASGWRVATTIPAPTLRLTSEDLSRRYALDSIDIARIRDTMAKNFGALDGVFQLTPSGFLANLHYHIYTCVAAVPVPWFSRESGELSAQRV